jgi:tripartite-type tricarboxylate transporter receptor subunit TctC
MQSMSTARRRFLRQAAGAAALPAFASRWAQAQAAFPNRPIALAVSLQAGSGSDVASRVVADSIGRRLGAAFVVENVPGAGGVVGASKVFNAAPDGYTIGALNNGLICVVPNLKDKPAFDVGALTPVSMIADLPSVMVVPSALPVKTLADFVAYSKANAGKLSYGSVGMGSPQHLAMEMLKNSTGADLLHVPYRGGPQTVTDVVAGQIHATWIAIPVAAPFIKSGQLRGLAVGGAARSAVIPQVPTLKEGGVRDFEYLPWIAFYGPPKLPEAITKKLHAAIQEALAEPAVIEKLSGAGLEARPMPLPAFEKLGVSERAEMAKVIQKLKLG